MDDCLKCTRFYDQRLLWDSKGGTEFSLLDSGGESSVLPFFLEAFGQWYDKQGPLSEYTRPDQCKNLFETEDDPCQVEDLVLRFLEDYLLCGSSPHTFSDNPVALLSHDWSNPDSIDGQSPSSKRNKCPHGASYTFTTILAIEKVKKDWFWDLTVEEVHNYLSADGTLHHNSGKTSAGIAEDIWTALGTHPHKKVKVPNKGWICATDFAHGVQSVLVPKIKSMLPRESIKQIVRNSQGVETIFQLKNGSLFELKSYDQDLSKYESADIDWVHFDEPPDQRIYQAAIRGLVDRDGFNWLTLTPISEAWIYQDLWLPSLTQNKGIESFKMTIFDNPHLCKEGVQQFQDSVSEQYRAARLYGEFLELQGKVFKSFNIDTHVIQSFWPHPDWPVYMAVDPHVYGRKNQAALWMTVTPDEQCILFDELWEDLRIEDLRDKIIAHDFSLSGLKVLNVQDRVIDTSINIRESVQHQNFKKLIESPGLWGKTLHFKMANKKNLLNPGIEYINSLLEGKTNPKTTLKTPQLLVDARCKRLISEFQLHGWHNARHPNRSGIIEKEMNTYNDMISCMRYIFNLNPIHIKKLDFLNFPIESFQTYGGGSVMQTPPSFLPSSERKTQKPVRFYV